MTARSSRPDLPTPRPLSNWSIAAGALVVFAVDQTAGPVCMGALPADRAGLRHNIRLTIVVVLLGAAPPLTGAGAEDVIKAGKWEYSSVPGGTWPLAGVPPSNVRVGPEGLTFFNSACITAANPLPPMARGPSVPKDADHPCAVDKTEVNGGTVSWSTTCATPRVTFNVEGTVHYHGETLDGELVTRLTTTGHPPLESTRPMQGRYLGTCDPE